jgi:hypothetical protein
MSEVCPTCGAPCASPAELVDHVKTVHQNEDPAADLEMNPEAHVPGLVCAACGRRFSTARALAEHNLRPHPQFQPVEKEAPEVY